MNQELFNIKNNPFVGLVIDIYVPSNNMGIVICGSVKLVEQGELFKKVYTLFFNKFEWVENNPWFEGEAPFLIIYPNSNARLG